ncbi:MAG: hypothetical protein POELPBGB_03437 [Bacteroidia bacterium]|nr:hypothetical protein [Bacteroidia bacterium]
MFEVFKTKFHQHVADSKKESGKSYFALRSEWGFDAEQMLRNKTAPDTRTVFSYCRGINSCVVELLITFLKDQIDHHRLVSHINKTFNTNYINH